MNTEKIDILKVKVYDLSQECRKIENVLRQKEQQIGQLNTEIVKIISAESKKDDKSKSVKE